MSYGARAHVGEQMVMAACGFEPASPWEYVEAPELDRARELNLPCRWESGVLPGWWPLRVPWSPSARPGSSRSQGKGGLQDRAEMGAPVCELHHLLLPGIQAPSLGDDGEYAIVLHAHLVQLSVVKLCSLCPQLQVNLLVTWKEEGPGRGVQRKRSEAPQSEQTRGISEPRVGVTDGGPSTPLHFILPTPHLASCPMHGRANMVVVESHFIVVPNPRTRTRAVVTKQKAKTGAPHRGC